MELNHRHSDFQSDTLPTELFGEYYNGSKLIIIISNSLIQNLTFKQRLEKYNRVPTLI